MLRRNIILKISYQCFETETLLFPLISIGYIYIYVPLIIFSEADIFCCSQTIFRYRYRKENDDGNMHFKNMQIDVIWHWEKRLRDLDDVMQGIRQVGV